MPVNGAKSTVGVAGLTAGLPVGATGSSSGPIGGVDSVKDLV